MHLTSVEEANVNRSLAPWGVPVVVWRFNEHRRAIAADSYGDAKAILRRVLRRFRGGEARYRDFQGQLTNLDGPGSPLIAAFRNHRVGLVKAYSEGILEAGPSVLICDESGDDLKRPILFDDVESARSFVRRLKGQGVAIAGWRRFEVEPATDAATGQWSFALGPSLHTKLESELISTLGPAGRERQGFFVSADRRSPTGMPGS